MKVIIILAAIVLTVLGAPQQYEKDAVVVRQDFDNIGIDHYNYAYETSNRISAQEQGQIQNAGTDNEAIAVHGQYSYIGPDGVQYTVVYVADENGFQPQGAHIPH